MPKVQALVITLLSIWLLPPADAHARDVDVLEEIVVTAQRIEQNLQDVPMAVTAFLGDELAKRQVVDFEQLVLYTPGLNLTVAARTLVQPVMRGGSSDEDGPGVDLAVGLFVDEVYLGRNIDFSFDLFDLERVEVLRGPQGTLFGRNVTGGLISVTTKNPTNEFEGKGEIIFGKYNRFDVRGALNVPIIDDVLATRISFSSRNADGAISNASGPDLLQDDQDSFRGKLLYTPNDEFRFLFTSYYTRDRSVGAHRDIVGFNENLLPALAALIDPDPRKANIDAAGRYDRRIWGVSGKLDWDIDFGTVTSVTSWHKNRSDLSTLDVDGTPEAILTSPDNVNDAKQFTQELRHSYVSDDGRISWVGGVYYLNIDWLSRQGVDLVPFPGSFLSIIGAPPVLGGFFEQRIKTESYAGFGQLTYAFPSAEGLRLTAGGRYTKDKKSGFTADGGGVTGPPYNINVSGDWAAFTPKFVLDYDLTEDILTYLSATSGFKSGGFAWVTTKDEAMEGFDPEKVWSYEIGIKSRLFADRLQANIAAFRADYTDLQFRSGTVGTESFVGNAGAASITGVEMEFQAVPTENLTLFLNYAYQDGEFDELMIGETDFSGNELPLTPKHSFNLGGEYYLPLTDTGDLVLSADYQYKSDSFLDPENTAGAVQKIDGIINASVSFVFLDGKARISLFGRNLTDEAYITRVSSLGVFLGQVNFANNPPFSQVLAGSFNEPRRWGVSLSYVF